jgi:hypothetical protein
MKSSLLEFLPIIGMFSILSFSAQAQIPEAFQGMWRWHAPTIDTQYANGSMEIKNDSIITIYDGIDERFLSYNVVFRNDSVFWNYVFSGTEVFAVLKFESQKRADGYGSNIMGKFPVELFREESK